MGGIVGLCDVTYAMQVLNLNTEIVNCINEADVGIKIDGSSIGGIVGYSYGCNITNCINKGDIYGGDYVDTAGIAGRFSYGYIINCVNEGNVSSEYGASGIANGPASPVSGVIISNCVNKGIITSINNASGIVDDIASDYYIVQVQNCVNEGTIVCAGDYYGAICYALNIKEDTNYPQNNYYLDTSCDRACLDSNDNFSVVTSIPDSITPYSAGNAPTVAALVDKMIVEESPVHVKLYPYYNTNISTVTFSDWDISNDKVAEIVNDTIVLKKNGTFELDYNTSFTAKNGNIDLGTINIVNKFIKVNLTSTKKYILKYLKQYNNYLFCLFVDNK